jgi:hypothetical protein
MQQMTKSFDIVRSLEYMYVQHTDDCYMSPLKEKKTQACRSIVTNSRPG